jgi:heme exporter protein A
MLQVHSLTFDYLDKPLLSDVTFSLASGTLLHLCGGNGAGKTTLLKLLAGLLQPQEGSIVWKEKPITDNLHTFQQQVCYVGHKLGLSLELTIRENCFFDLHWQRKAISFSDLLERFDLMDFADTPCFQLSQGQRRRVALLRIAMTDACLWLLDEPLVALDKESTLTLITCFQEHLAKNGCIIMTSHQNLPDSFGNYEVYSL